MRQRTLDRSRSHAVYLPDSLWDLIIDAADQRSISASEMIRTAIGLYFPDGNPKVTVQIKGKPVTPTEADLEFDRFTGIEVHDTQQR